MNLEQLCSAIGISKIKTADPFDLSYFESVLKECLAYNEPSVIIAKRPCFLLKDYKPKIKLVSINNEKCVKCGMCFKFGCPAIEKDPESGKTLINKTLCVHCGLCAKVCKPQAIIQAKEEAN